MKSLTCRQLLTPQGEKEKMNNDDTDLEFFYESNIEWLFSEDISLCILATSDLAVWASFI